MWFEIYTNELTNAPSKDLIFLWENKIRGGISSVMGDRYVKLDDKKRCCM